MQHNILHCRNLALLVNSVTLVNIDLDILNKIFCGDMHVGTILRDLIYRDKNCRFYTELSIIFNAVVKPLVIQNPPESLYWP